MAQANPQYTSCNMFTASTMVNYSLFIDFGTYGRQKNVMQKLMNALKCRFVSEKSIHFSLKLIITKAMMPELPTHNKIVVWLGLVCVVSFY